MYLSTILAKNSIGFLQPKVIDLQSNGELYARKTFQRI